MSCTNTNDVMKYNCKGILLVPEIDDDLDYITIHRTLSLFNILIPELIDIIIDYIASCWQPGDQIACLDTVVYPPQWRLATVHRVRNEVLLIHFNGFTCRWDTWVKLGSQILSDSNSIITSYGEEFHYERIEYIDRPWANQKNRVNVSVNLSTCK
jgi:hypothetical protein